jgi:hypothetical protein
MPALIAGIPLRLATHRVPCRDGRVKPGHDNNNYDSPASFIESAFSFARAFSS